ncbi:MAG TPA: radical SAM protein, partial [Elusimicrobiales bacterium]|nr:radical SAM protein [Elusimicrobiales bacterium]
MKILLCYPFLGNPNQSPPLGIVSLATYLRKHGYGARLCDSTFFTDFAHLEQELRRYQPDIVGFSLLTLFAHHLPALAKTARELRPNSLIIAGGPHVTAAAAEVLAVPEVDLCVMGEGERTLLELFKAAESGTKDFSSLRGLALRGKDGSPQFTPPQPFIENLDEIGAPDRALLPSFPQYLAFPTCFPYFMPHTYILTTRGCPFACTFCQPMLSKQFGSKIRQRSPGSVLEELERLAADYKLQSVYFADETFLANRAWAKEVCAGIRARGLHKRLVFMAQTNVRTFDEETAAFMRESGFIMTIFGAESGNDRILSEVYKKPQTRRHIIDAFAAARRYGLITEASLIVGAAEETVQSLEDTVSLVRELKADFLDVHYLTPTPGSEIYDTYLKRGALNYSTDSSPDRYTPGLLKYESVDGETLVRYRNKILEASSAAQPLF